jgi:hypothetical protein
VLVVWIVPQKATACAASGSRLERKSWIERAVEKVANHLCEIADHPALEQQVEPIGRYSYFEEIEWLFVVGRPTKSRTSSTSNTQPFIMTRALGVSGTFSHHISVSVSPAVMAC